MKKVFIKTLGCKVNSYDSNALANQFKERGYEITDSQESSDISVINSCSVTQNAEKDARYLLRRFKRDNPNSKRIITGCYAQIDSANLAELDEVDFVVPNEAKELLVDIIDEREKDGSLKDGSSKLPSGLKAVSKNKQSHFKSSLMLFDKSESSKTRVFIKIQDGCNGFCSYCQIPYARGASRSVAPNKVLEEIKRLSDDGVKEVVFTGIHIGDYGKDLDHYKDSKNLPFVEVLNKIISDTEIARIRISSLEPAEFTPDLAALMQENKIFCDHLHLPLQSGSNKILKLMNRQYDKERYFESIETARKIFTNPFLGCDVIPGFPGETDADFEETFEFIKKCGLTALHVFPYSKRPNTAAIRMPNHIDPKVIKERAQILRDYSKERLSQYYRMHIGKEVEVLWEADRDSSGRLVGKTTNYLNVAAPESAEVSKGMITKVSLKGLLGNEKLLGVPKI
jgi:threonylcarbamoyladenosine tRNA methylthiotransferase MtaB